MSTYGRENDDDIGIDYDMLMDDTDKAWKIRIDDKIHWFPKDHARLYFKKKKIFVPLWLARRKNLV